MSGSPLPSLSDLRLRYVDRERPLPRGLEARLRADPRRGAAAILKVVDRRRHAARAEGQRLRTILRYERALWSRGVIHVAGVDEAGMSPLAGPVVAAAVILHGDYRLQEVDDSKRLTADQRERLGEQIRRDAVCWGVGMAEPEEIDRINIYHAGLLAMRRAVEALSVPPEHLLIDARRLRDVPVPQQAIIKGDQKSISIAAASIIAKTTRDHLMRALDARYPGYGLARHKGYPVREHVEAIARNGVLPIHRRSFTPVRLALGLDPVQVALFPTVEAAAEKR